MGERTSLPGHLARLPWNEAADICSSLRILSSIGGCVSKSPLRFFSHFLRRPERLNYVEVRGSLVRGLQGRLSSRSLARALASPGG